MTCQRFSIRFSRTSIMGILFFVSLLLPTMAGANDKINRPVTSLKQVLQQGKLRVGVSQFTPWTLKNNKGELIGFEIDVAHQLAKDLGVQLEIKEFDWAAIIPALLNKKIDIIVAGIVITPQRALKVSFSRPYANSGIGLATNISLTKNFTSLDDLNHPNVKIGVVAGTVAEDLARRVFTEANLQKFQKSEEAIQSVIQGKVHGYVEHNPLPTFIALDHPDQVDEPLSEPLLMTKAGFAVNKGDPDFINFLNAWIIAREADSWLTSAHDYWFKSLRWREAIKKKK